MNFKTFPTYKSCLGADYIQEFENGYSAIVQERIPGLFALVVYFAGYPCNEIDAQEINCLSRNEGKINKACERIEKLPKNPHYAYLYVTETE